MKRITIRDLIWLVLLIAEGLAWWIDRQSILGKVRRYSPILYETITGHEIDTNNLRRPPER